MSPACADVTEHVCVVQLPALALHTHRVGEPEHAAVSVMLVLIVAVDGAVTVQFGTFDTTQVSTWLGAVPDRAKLSQLLSLREMDAPCACAIKQVANAA